MTIRTVTGSKYKLLNCSDNLQKQIGYINEQILELNTLVIRWCVDEIITNIKQYVNYRKNVSTLPLPLEHAQLPSQKGTKTLEIKSFI